MHNIFTFFACLMCSFTYLRALFYELILTPQREFVLLNNINFGDIVPNIQNIQNNTKLLESFT